MRASPAILHPSDFSPASRPAFAAAVAAAKERNAPLLVAHVLSMPLPMTADGYVSPRTYENLLRGAQAEGRRNLQTLVARATKAGVRATGVLLEGNAAHEIVRAARARRAGMIVMGTHGRTGLAKLFLGSVAQRVIGGAPCPVLTVRGKSSSK